MGRSRQPRQRRIFAPLQNHHEDYRREFSLRTRKPQSYGNVIRRTLFFQLRLAADNLRDLLLSPIAIFAALLGLLRPSDPSWALDRLMIFGRATDRWINLFEEEPHVPAERGACTIDDLFDHVETKIKSTLDPETPTEESTWASSFAAFQATHQSRK
ncbi:hypothetical protein [Cohaesibacter haloalkalitolerans]|uniref:hypothetical protein n=1 Tax=Cohaesibacter haloalkalitolerans TaxID=1162980 RepID=UPI0013C4ABDC|nr:hypothetical protein [Cohaesibacter haloalkalitolerans]